MAICPFLCTRRFLQLAALLLFCASPAWAQDMRVYTTVTELSPAGGQPRVLSHSLTLFHAGKVYDYMEELGEVVIFEPAQHRFVVLGRDLSITEIGFAELNHFLDSARAESVRYIEELRSQDDAAAARKSAAVRFQMQPNLHLEIDEAKSRLLLTGDVLSYRVKGVAQEPMTPVQQYLDYADWAARLNFVLHSRAMFPEARLQLNQHLRERNWLPVQVDLVMEAPQHAHLRAEHAFAWEFQPIDRRSISHWEQLLTSAKVRWLTFHEYQQQLIAQKR